MNEKERVVRFAPSPTGRLHIGHACSVLFTAAHVKEGGRFLLRIENIDPGRCRTEFEDGIYEDLAWLGLHWEEPVRRQSEHLDVYRAALAKLDALGVIYPCFCTRKEIEAEIEAAASAPHGLAQGPDGYLYPGTCRHLNAEERAAKIAQGAPYAMRLDVAKAKEVAGKDLHWTDLSAGVQLATPEIHGDVVIARKDVPASYHLSVTVDDDLQGVTLVTRGADLFEATHIHRLLQELLGLAVPDYHHHPLMHDEEGKRYAKRNNAVTLQHMREVDGLTPDDIRARVSPFIKVI